VGSSRAKERCAARKGSRNVRASAVLQSGCTQLTTRVGQAVACRSSPFGSDDKLLLLYSASPSTCFIQTTNTMYNVHVVCSGTDNSSKFAEPGLKAQPVSNGSLLAYLCRWVDHHHKPPGELQEDLSTQCMRHAECWRHCGQHVHSAVCACHLIATQRLTLIDSLVFDDNVRTYVRPSTGTLTIAQASPSPAGLQHVLQPLLKDIVEDMQDPGATTVQQHAVVHVHSRWRSASPISNVR
jgi:hypothetical protein